MPDTAHPPETANGHDGAGAGHGRQPPRPAPGAARLVTSTIYTATRAARENTRARPPLTAPEPTTRAAGAEEMFIHSPAARAD